MHCICGVALFFISKLKRDNIKMILFKEKKKEFLIVDPITYQVKERGGIDLFYQKIMLKYWPNSKNKSDSPTEHQKWTNARPYITWLCDII